MKRQTVCILAILLPVTAGAWPWSPSTYEECVQKRVAEAKTETAARILAQQCRKEFPEPKPPLPPVTCPTLGGMFDDIVCGKPKPAP